MKRPAHLALASIALLALTAHAAVAAAKTPIPERAPADRATHDFANVISAADEATIDTAMADLRRQTGVAIAVVTVAALEDETIDELALRILTSWGVGRQDGKDRGVVVALAVADRKVFVSTGYGVEGFLPDGKVGGLIDRAAVPYLRQNDFSRGLVALSIALAQESAKEFNVTLDAPGAVAPPPPRYRRSPGGSIGRIILGVLLVVVFGFVAVKRPDLLQLILFSLLFSGRGGGGFGGGGFGGGGGGGGFGGFGGGGFGGGGGGAGRDF